MSGPKKQPAWALLNHPVLILVSILIGIFIGLFSKRISSLLAPIGEMYLYFIQMCVIPILIAAIVSSIAKIIQIGRASCRERV
jgi:proton glutamate symport protein